MDLLSQPVLVLNSCFIPITVKPAKKAICMVYLEKAQVLKASTKNYIQSEKLNIPIPHVILLSNFYMLPKRKMRITRQTIFSRDNYTCAYCNKQVTSSKLTLDHIIPKSRWKEVTKNQKQYDFHSWENVVTACKDCNTKKSNKLLNELKWKHPIIKQLDYFQYGIPGVEKYAEEFGWSEYLLGKN
ncbi:MAG: HNH endonuclease [Leptospiraceae bacterium]|nr:HNH endonuclease [Leptospiraceae bacterium]MCP5495725.1 HNH endonuclease [Leptospiraceae bacterium]